MRALKFIVKILVSVILLVALYAVGLKFTVLPAGLAPQELFNKQYAELKLDLSNDISANSSTSGMSEALLSFLNTVEESYAAKNNSKPAATPSTNHPHTEPDVAPSSTDQVQEPQSAVDKATETVNQYNNSLDQQQQQLDKL